jgi:RHS repeat-associated protein
MQSGLTSALITDINGSTWSANYSYKKDGNIEQKTINGSAESYEYDTTPDGNVFDSDIMTKAGNDDLTWNNNGQLAQTPTITFNCNWDGKLRSAVIGSDTVDIKYDPMGNRVYKASSTAGNRRYIVDISGGLPVILCEIDPENYTIKRAYIYANSQILAQKDFETAEPEKYFYVHDRLGSIRLVVNDVADVNNTYTYSPFGEVFASECNETVYNPFRFTGQWYDSEIGQYYLRARMYDPQLMRFTARDPEDGEYEEPMSLHKYLYCWNDPIDYIDMGGNSRRSASHGVQQFTLEEYEQMWHARFGTPEEINLIRTTTMRGIGVVIQNFAAYASQPAARALSPVFAVVTPAAAAPGMYRIAYEMMFRNGIINAVIRDFWGEETDLYDIQDYWAGY